MLYASRYCHGNLIAKRNYTFDSLGRVATRTQARGTVTRNDVFGYNDRSELTSATLGTDDYAYNFDNIGNRITAAELADEIDYTANNLNQYTAIEKNSGTPFVPTFDNDGNQLTVQTATGVWNVSYNAENRPVTFTQGTTVIECKYDSMGRRFEKKVSNDNVVTFWERYAYKGYLQIAAFNVSNVDEAEVLSLATTTYWDPTESTATRPLAFTDHTAATPATYFYTHDLTKNVCELLSRNGSAVEIVTTYDYTPFGAVIASNSATPNTFTFSSEVLDAEISLIYYNYRHYNPLDGRWISRDPIAEQGGWNMYMLIYNNSMIYYDKLGYGFWSGLGRIALASLSGAAAGAVSGAIAGAVAGFVIGGPAGAMAGLAAGAAAGAVAGAIAGGISQGLDEIISNEVSAKGAIKSGLLSGLAAGSVVGGPAGAMVAASMAGITMISISSRVTYLVMDSACVFSGNFVAVYCENGNMQQATISAGLTLLFARLITPKIFAELDGPQNNVEMFLFDLDVSLVIEDINTVYEQMER